MIVRFDFVLMRVPPVSLNGENGSEAKMKKNEDTAGGNYVDNFVLTVVIAL